MQAERASNYNVFVEDGDRVLGVNLLSRAAMDLSHAAFNAYQQHLAGNSHRDEPPDTATRELIAALRANGFIVPTSFDEIDYIRSRSRAERFGSRQLGLVIAPTMSCNFACHYCFEAHSQESLSSEASDRIGDLVEERIDAYDELAVQWFGGEPLRVMPVIRDLSESFLDICRRHRKGYAATVISNGYLMDPSVSKQLVQLGVTEVQITLDGDRQLHDRTRTEGPGVGSFDQILDNIRGAPDELRINVRVHLAPFNVDSVDSLIETLAAEGMAGEIDMLYFAPLFDYKTTAGGGQYKSDGKRFATSEQFAALEIEAIQAASAHGFALKDMLDVSYGICTAVRSNTLVVDAAGRLSKCYKDVGVAHEAVGDLTSGVTRPDAVSEWLDVEVPRDEECGACTFLPVCLGGCTKQWREAASKEVICTPLRYNFKDRIRAYFRDASGLGGAGSEAGSGLPNSEGDG